VSDAKRRLAEAQRDLRRLNQEIAPFVKPRDRRDYTTAGQWRDTRRAIEREREKQARSQRANKLH
jgi:hypothetical protein